MKQNNRIRSFLIPFASAVAIAVAWNRSGWLFDNTSFSSVVAFTPPLQWSSSSISSSSVCSRCRRTEVYGIGSGSSAEDSRQRSFATNGNTRMGVMSMRRTRNSGGVTGGSSSSSRVGSTSRRPVFLGRSRGNDGPSAAGSSKSSLEATSLFLEIPTDPAIIQGVSASVAAGVAMGVAMAKFFDEQAERFRERYFINEELNGQGRLPIPKQYTMAYRLSERNKRQQRLIRRRQNDNNGLWPTNRRDSYENEKWIAKQIEWQNKRPAISSTDNLSAAPSASTVTTAAPSVAISSYSAVAVATPATIANFVASSVAAAVEQRKSVPPSSSDAWQTPQSGASFAPAPAPYAFSTQYAAPTSPPPAAAAVSPTATTSSTSSTGTVATTGMSSASNYLSAISSTTSTGNSVKKSYSPSKWSPRSSKPTNKVNQFVGGNSYFGTMASSHTTASTPTSPMPVSTTASVTIQSSIPSTTPPSTPAPPAAPTFFVPEVTAASAIPKKSYSVSKWSPSTPGAPLASTGFTGQSSYLASMGTIRSSSSSTLTAKNPSFSYSPPTTFVSKDDDTFTAPLPPSSTSLKPSTVILGSNSYMNSLSSNTAAATTKKVSYAPTKWSPSSDKTSGTGSTGSGSGGYLLNMSSLSFTSPPTLPPPPAVPVQQENQPKYPNNYMSSSSQGQQQTTTAPKKSYAPTKWSPQRN